MKEVLLSGRKICKSFQKGKEKIEILHGIDLDIYNDDFTVIMGPSGAGKSTLLYALSGMEKLSSGQLFYKDQKISSYSEKQMAGLRAGDFGFIFQQPHLVSNLSLYENVVVTGYLDSTKTEKQVNQNAHRIFEKMHLDDSIHRYPHQTSGGESQRAAIARAIINEPDLLFADEPTGALNRSNSDEVFDLLTHLHNDSQVILMVTHDLRAAVRGTRILYLEDGNILDELRLPAFKKEDEKERESKVSTWLSELSW